MQPAQEPADLEQLQPAGAEHIAQHQSDMLRQQQEECRSVFALLQVELGIAREASQALKQLLQKDHSQCRALGAQAQQALVTLKQQEQQRREAMTQHCSAQLHAAKEACLARQELQHQAERRVERQSLEAALAAAELQAAKDAGTALQHQLEAEQGTCAGLRMRLQDLQEWEALKVKLAGSCAAAQTARDDSAAQCRRLQEQLAAAGSLLQSEQTRSSRLRELLSAQCELSQQVQQGLLAQLQARQELGQRMQQKLKVVSNPYTHTCVRPGIIVLHAFKLCSGSGSLCTMCMILSSP